MNLTLSLLVLARHLLAAPPAPATAAEPHLSPAVSGAPVLVELIPIDPAERHATCAVDVDRHSEELLISASPSTWSRLKEVFSVTADSIDRNDLVRIHRIGAASAEALAAELRELNPHLDILADPQTGSILVSAADGLA